ncbi:MAG: aminotransferase class I/II-fold pyridoxal phosphate-dependent enzyme [Paludisphaera borealis]|uniref:aminotransferase class I/II-fold pyridoxal phosphate-dependent enzyme n=1 Tax=Paludisphaera borealis TaxID=1387353 RepID=UPI00284C1010|nr:aminotransferase class I/II-fold pyridoxal phosphate-dependent enzyme [Paludisphaera borealis]MDR3619841.1 aminotransferase class I/II-fold pyridoxal phosphate-dependent enzyme [Paludisphaera borealis]
MIDPKTNPGSEEHESTERYDIEVAPRVRNLPPYLFGKINELKYRKRRDGVDVIDLGMGNPTDPPDQSVIDKLCEAVQDSRNHRYSVANGVFNLRREVAAKYENRFGVKLDPDQEIVATIGSKEGFSHMCLALLGPGDTALVPAPSFPVHVHAIALASANVITLDCRDSQVFLANIARVCESLLPRPKILVINYPHNPSSTVVDPGFFEEIVGLAKKYRFFVIHDFAYGDIGFDGYQPPSFLSVKGATQVGCEFTTMSKGYNMAGWRVGFAAGNRDMLGALKAIKGYYDYGIFQAVQVASIVALRHGEEGRLAQVAEYQDRRDVMVRGLRRLGWEVDPPRAGMFVWAAMPEPWRSQMGSMDFAMKLLEEANVVVSPGRGFGETGEGFLRLALVENAHRLRQAIRQIGRCLRVEQAVN